MIHLVFLMLQLSAMVRINYSKQVELDVICQTEFVGHLLLDIVMIGLVHIVGKVERSNSVFLMLLFSWYNVSATHFCVTCFFDTHFCATYFLCGADCCV